MDTTFDESTDTPQPPGLISADSDAEAALAELHAQAQAEVTVDTAEEEERSLRLASEYGLDYVDMRHFRIKNDLFRRVPFDLMLRYSFGMEAPAARIEKAVRQVIQSGIRTADIAFGREPVSTRALAEAVIERLEASPD